MRSAAWLRPPSAGSKTERSPSSASGIWRQNWESAIDTCGGGSVPSARFLPSDPRMPSRLTSPHSAPLGRRTRSRTEFAAAPLPVPFPLWARVKRLLDLAPEPQQIAAHLGPLAAAPPGLRVPGAFDSFEVAVRAVLGQQISVKA